MVSLFFFMTSAGDKLNYTVNETKKGKTFLPNDQSQDHGKQDENQKNGHDDKQHPRSLKK